MLPPAAWTGSRSSLAHAVVHHPRCRRLTGRGLPPTRTGSAAARWSGAARTDLGIVEDPGYRAAQDGAEVDHVPRAAPRDEGCDADRAFLAVLPVDQPGTGDVPVADRVIADARVHPRRV